MRDQLSHAGHLLLRRLRKASGAAAVNLFALSAGFASCAALLLIVAHEMSYDRSFNEPDRLYRIAFSSTHGDVMRQHARGPSALHPVLAQDFPGVSAAAAIFGHQDAIARVEEHQIELRRLYHASTSFFEVFDFDLLYGDPELALAEPGSIVLAGTTAERLFGRLDVLGQTLDLDGRAYTVRGVTPPEMPRSHLRFDALVYARSDLFGVWNGFVAALYVRAAEGADPVALEEAVNQYVDEHAASGWGELMEAFLQPVVRIHLHSHLEQEMQPNGDAHTLFVLVLGALLILFMACLGYVNVSVARLSDRTVEVGVRRAVGASRAEVGAQFLAESLLLALLSCVIAGVLVWLTAPWIGAFFGVALARDAGTLVLLGGGLIACALLIGIGAGLYPALLLARLEPLHVLRAQQPAWLRRLGVRRLLVVAQLGVTASFILAATLIGRQLDFVTSQSLGYDSAGLLYVRLHEELPPGRYEVLRQAWLALPDVHMVSAGALPGQTSGGPYIRRPSGESVLLHRFPVQHDYPELMRIGYAAGRPLSTPSSQGAASEILLNETAVRDLGLASPIGHEFRLDGFERRVVGVVKDFHFFSLHEPIPPMYLSADDDVGPHLFVRVAPGHERGVAALLEPAWRRVAGEAPFSAEYVDDYVRASYEGEARLSRVFNAFSVLAYLVAALGLLSLVTYSLQRRARELAIRKALGAPRRRLVGLLTSESAVLMAVALVLSVPLVYAATSAWLSSFVYRAPFSLVSYVGPIAALLALMLATVGLVALRAVRRSPAHALRES